MEIGSKFALLDVSVVDAEAVGRKNKAVVVRTASSTGSAT